MKKHLEGYRVENAYDPSEEIMGDVVLSEPIKIIKFMVTPEYLMQEGYPCIIHRIVLFCARRDGSFIQLSPNQAIIKKHLDEDKFLW